MAEAGGAPDLCAPYYPGCEATRPSEDDWARYWTPLRTASDAFTVTAMSAEALDGLLPAGVSAPAAPACGPDAGYYPADSSATTDLAAGTLAADPRAGWADASVGAVLRFGAMGTHDAADSGEAAATAATGALCWRLEGEDTPVPAVATAVWRASADPAMLGYDYWAAKENDAALPFNVGVADAALSGEVLETLFAGAGYVDDLHRGTLMGLVALFPALCGERAKAAATSVSRAEVCAMEIGLLTWFALLGEDRQELWAADNSEWLAADELYYDAPEEGAVDFADYAWYAEYAEYAAAAEVAGYEAMMLELDGTWTADAPAAELLPVRVASAFLEGPAAAVAFDPYADEGDGTAAPAAAAWWQTAWSTPQAWACALGEALEREAGPGPCLWAASVDSVAADWSGVQETVEEVLQDCTGFNEVCVTPSNDSEVTAGQNALYACGPGAWTGGYAEHNDLFTGQYSDPNISNSEDTAWDTPNGRWTRSTCCGWEHTATLVDMAFAHGGTPGTPDADNTPAACYRPRGAGPMPLHGYVDYALFSEHMGQAQVVAAGGGASLDTLGAGELGTVRDPYGFEWGPASALDFAVTVWRWMSPPHSDLPSLHEYVSGMWTPTPSETTAGFVA